MYLLAINKRFNVLRYFKILNKEGKKNINVHWQMANLLDVSHLKTYFKFKLSISKNTSPIYKFMYHF